MCMVEFCELVIHRFFARHCMECLLTVAGRLGYFEQTHKFYDQKQLLSEITGHYSQQVVYIPVFYLCFLQLAH